jgi:hypothetical protein
MVGVDLGYRRKLSDQASVVVTLQDVLRSFHVRGGNDTPLLSERFTSDFDTRSIRVGLTWTFGGGRQKEPAFEFSGPGPT